MSTREEDEEMKIIEISEKLNRALPKIYSVTPPILKVIEAQERILDSAIKPLQKFSESLQPLIPPYIKIMETQQKILELALNPLRNMFEPFDSLMKQINLWNVPINLFLQKQKAISLLEKNQFIFFKNFNGSLLDEITETKNVNKCMEIFYSQNEYADIKEILVKCKQNAIMKQQLHLFSEIIKSYNQGLYNIAIIGLATISDNLLSIISETPITSFSKRIEILRKKLESASVLTNEEISEIIFLDTFFSFSDSFTDHSDFSAKEPKLLNRHWIMHGRSRKKYSKLDCIKVINYIYGLLLLSNINTTEECKDE